MEPSTPFVTDNIFYPSSVVNRWYMHGHKYIAAPSVRHHKYYNPPWLSKIMKRVVHTAKAKTKRQNDSTKKWTDDSLSFVAFPQFVGEQAKFAERQEISLLLLLCLLIEAAAAVAVGRWIDRGRRHWVGGRRRGLPLLPLLRLLLLTLSGAVDHFEDLRLGRVDVRLVEERLQSASFADDGAVLTAARMDCSHAAPYLKQFSTESEFNVKQDTGNI